jgi:hypothetical protein
MTGGVFVLHSTLEHVRHRFEATVWMIGRTDRLTGWVGDGTHLVDEKEGVDEVGTCRGDGAAYGKPGSLELPVRSDDACDFTNGDGLGHDTLTFVA